MEKKKLFRVGYEIITEEGNRCKDLFIVALNFSEVINSIEFVQLPNITEVFMQSEDVVVL
jgi:hypothetical protein